MKSVFLWLLLLVLTFTALFEDFDANPIRGRYFAKNESGFLLPTPTPYPGYHSPISSMLCIGGEKIYIAGEIIIPFWYAEKMGYLEKLAQAEYLGETREPAEDWQQPTEELQTNCIPAGYQVYHLETEEVDSYFIYSEYSDEDSELIYIKDAKKVP